MIKIAAGSIKLFYDQYVVTTCLILVGKSRGDSRAGFEDVIIS